MKTNIGAHRWWIVGISLVVVIGVLALGYWATKGPSGGQEQVFIEPPATGLETGPQQVLTEPQISPEGEETIVVPGLDIGLEPEAAISVPAYTLEMAGLAAETRILPVPVAIGDVATIVPMLGPAVPLSPEEEALMFAEIPYEFSLEQQFLPFFEDEFLPFLDEGFFLPTETLQQPEEATPEEAIEVPAEEAVAEETEEVTVEEDLFY